MGEGGLHIGIADAGQALAGRATSGDRRQAGAGRSVGRDGGQAVLDVAVLLDVQGDDRFEASAGVGVEVTLSDKLVGQAPGLVADPGLEGGDEGALVDQAVLKRE